ncbi:hypothetical protein V6S67_08010 [Arthrobacter sp. Soc17.1.1.1]|uniref:hypothetical protein n=1 Tax=Arthrobacter sp. Soc17.1.1.1 TaxID=3121277 RepID=UPI002FE4569A
MTTPRLYDSPEFIEIREIDEGDFLGVHLVGHVPFEDVDLFVAYQCGDWLDRSELRGYDVTHTYCRKVPIRTEYGVEGMRFQYQDSPGRGAQAVTRVEANRDWERWCVNHPHELAQTGVHKDTVAEDQGQLAIGDFIYLCRSCHDDYNRRFHEAYLERMRGYEASNA